jgi:hypothetical protein
VDLQRKSAVDRPGEIDLLAIDPALDPKLQRQTIGFEPRHQFDASPKHVSLRSKPLPDQ